ncbi:odorant receptor Or2-like isoform X1 [Vespa mandarinia]|uniref:odorant receptor Or2-like isoform X1 n=1 Tax=Vespa mandarinia TaxID=7446 RepID=UPI00162083C1|nr:odorant receptor Or2-like isoform X1 [Vespa mandarinia]XP_035725134.1 odorant receptor Or2-like isoform X1 [Vespa mandarinia]XP_035725135.1 odorant receptor Or2-like isoform X1 [Vespa mandarinia]XP_035725136.1 odorant receptor Or2-like isoform X1 [Vespa mandarinia]
MDLLVIRYYNINRLLLLVIGSWPMIKKSPINSFIQMIQSFFIYIILASSVLVQIFKLITSEPTLDLFVNVSSYAFLCMVYLGKYGFYMFHLGNIKCLIIRIQRNWNLLIDEKEREIMEEYTQKGKKFTFICLFLSCFTIILLLIWTSFLFISDILVPLNGSHRLECPFVAEYFIDQEVYYYPILLHMYTIFLVGLTVVIATEAFYVIIVQHACGLFHIVGYRFEQVFKESTLNSISLSRKSLEINYLIIRAINSHQNAIKFVDHMNSCFSNSYFMLIILSVISLIMNCTDILQAMNSNKNYNLVSASARILNAFVRIINIICYLFGVFYCGQKLIDCSINILEQAYTIPWYLASSKIKVSLMMVLQRSLKKSTLFLGNLFPMSFELFGTILKSTSCYITTLHALQY